MKLVIYMIHVLYIVSERYRLLLEAYILHLLLPLGLPSHSQLPARNGPRLCL